MKLSIQHVNDLNGNTQAVQIPIQQWQELLGKLTEIEKQREIKNDLKIAFHEVKQMQSGEIEKQEFSNFLDEL